MIDERREFLIRIAAEAMRAPIEDLRGCCPCGACADMRRAIDLFDAVGSSEHQRQIDAGVVSSMLVLQRAIVEHECREALYAEGLCLGRPGLELDSEPGGLDGNGDSGGPTS